MEATHSYFLMLQEYISSNQKFKQKKSSVDYRAFDTSNIIDIHKYLMKKYDIK